MGETEIYQRLWGLTLRRLKEEIDRTNSNQAAKKAGLNPSTLGRYISGERGARVNFETMFKVLSKLGVPMGEVVEALDPELGKIFVSLAKTTNRRLLEKIAAIAIAGRLEDLEKDVEYHYRKTKD